MTAEVVIVAAALWITATLYAIFAGADFGAGFWDLVAGGAERGARPRALIDRVLTPVWEANHVWLIFMLVVMWTAFPEAFAAITSTLFVPLSLAALGIVLRGAGFAFRHVVSATGSRRVLGATFALSSLLTPFFMGTVVGAIATGRVPAAGDGDRLTSWLNWPSAAIGALFIAACAYVAAVFLVAEARAAADRDLERYFRARAIGAAVVAGATAGGSLAVLAGAAPGLFADLVGHGWPLIALSALLGIAALVQLMRSGRAVRALAAGAVAAVVWGWGVAQSPDVLPGALTFAEAASPPATLWSVIVVAAAAVALVVPALVLLFSLQQRGALGDDD